MSNQKPEILLHYQFKFLKIFKKSRFYLVVFFNLILFFVASQSLAQVDTNNYPNQPVKLIVPYPPGGGSDILARILAEKAQSKLGQPIVIENKAGAGGNVGAEFVYRAQPDGYIFLFSAQPPMVANQRQFVATGFISRSFSLPRLPSLPRRIRKKGTIGNKGGRGCHVNSSAN